MGVRTQSRPGAVPAEVMAEVVASPRRREVLTSLDRQGGDVAASDVIRALCDDSDGQGCREVREELFEEHLPKLLAAGLVEYESQRDALVLCVESQRLQDLLARGGKT